MPQAEISTCAHCVGGHRNKVGPSISCETFYFFSNGSEIFHCGSLWRATSQFWHLQPMLGCPHALCNAIFAAFLWHATTRDEHRPVRWHCTSNLFNKCWPRTASEAQLSACGMPQAKLSTCAHCVGGHRNKVGPSISCETFYFFLNGSEIFQCGILWHATSQYWHLQPMRGCPHALCNAIFAAFLWHATTPDEHPPVRWHCTSNLLC